MLHELSTDTAHPRPPVAQQPYSCLGRLIVEVSRSHATLATSPVVKSSTRRRDLYLTTHNTHNRQTSVPPTGFEPAVPIRERSHTHVLDRLATGIGGTAH